ncbi:MFS transporter, PAT family, beta-lactamase induction signal transducer AmpG [Allopseudospirillum japonicum]|uniref:MFS transporter, PAT family, beta-lactamase induction signal transducer AmpG n=2 Tax=Allopseudospirillum japonicum TaxID=64971 RepID=A0A1H6QBZ6_9GAMM|nr:MFS transporter, PAT family, beta-lactamase induction signal transducer AmpG [Allopseudospirillum japonicum]
MLITFSMGFSSGLPLLLTGSVLQLWMRQGGVSLQDLGLLTLVGLPYTLKFFWAPLLDRFQLTTWGRRRSWLLLSQITLTLALVALSQGDPHLDAQNMALWALLIAFFSATQDIGVDAYRREHLPESELGLGSSVYVYGYRTGMLLASGGGLILAGYWSWEMAYLLMAAAMILGMLTTWLAPEPYAHVDAPKTLKQAIVQPFVSFWQLKYAGHLLLFVLLYKIGDAIAAAMTAPLYVDLGFSEVEIGTTVKLFGFWATLAGGLIGGLLMVRIGIYRGLLIFGILQMLSTAGFVYLVYQGHHLPSLAAVVALENLASGMGTAAYIAFMAALTDIRFTATQYALLSSLAGVPRVLLSAPSGYLAVAFGWEGFFICCTLIAIPGLLLLPYIKQHFLVHQTSEATHVS